ncbi:MAG: conjugative transposon protein TraM [Bacteroidales bacterium]|nr:conjugative transposon protein TraM [Bacteroidales bacterium]
MAEEQVTVNVPEGVAVPVSDSKTEAYRNTHISTDQYFAQLSAEEDISLVSSDGDDSNEVPLSAGEDEGAAAKRVFGDSEVASVSIAVERSPVKSGMTGSSGYGQMTPEQKLEYDRRRAEMVRDVLAEGEIAGQAGNDDDDKPRPEMLSRNDIATGNDGIITSLDDDFDDPSVRYSSSAKVPFRCMFVRDQKVVDGQRVTVRLLEDYSVDGVFVPANTHLAAVCKVSDRLELSVRSVEINGRILPLQLVAYDTDGMAGIYCPETSASRNSRRASSDAISAVNSTFGGLVGDLANTVLRTGATIAKSASGELSVKVVSGYEFYLVKSER